MSLPTNSCPLNFEKTEIHRIHSPVSFTVVFRIKAFHCRYIILYSRINEKKYIHKLGYTILMLVAESIAILFFKKRSENLCGFASFMTVNILGIFV